MFHNYSPLQNVLSVRHQNLSETDVIAEEFLMLPVLVTGIFETSALCRYVLTSRIVRDNEVNLLTCFWQFCFTQRISPPLRATGSRNRHIRHLLTCRKMTVPCVCTILRDNWLSCLNSQLCYLRMVNHNRYA